MIGASTRLFAVLGDPVAHSLSPRIQNPALQSAGIDAVYVALRCDGDGLAGLMRGLAFAGGGGNVTIPHKRAAARLVDEPTAEVVRTGACNTFWAEDGRLFGDNTDVAGLRGSVSSLLEGPAEGLRVLLLGAGGAARGALVGLLADGVGEVTVHNRTSERARALAEELGEGRTGVADEVEVAGRRFDLIVNATALGLRDGDPMPVDLDTLGPCGAVLDMVYRVDETAFVREARRRGIPAMDGGEMLVRQGAAAFERWTRSAAPLSVMFDALRDARVAG